MDTRHGYFVISLDFELFWGMFDTYSLEAYGPNVYGERTAIPRILELFKEYDIHATWATVGMLMARSKEELRMFLPKEELFPTYKDERMSSYHHLTHDTVGKDEHDDPYHFGYSLVRMILDTPGQEVANHTFSHFYCIDGTENRDQIFAADLEAHRKISATYGLVTESIVFPRNQWTEKALEVCRTHGIRAYRGNENHFLYRARRGGSQSLLIRGFRLLDHYINLTGHHTYPLPRTEEGVVMNIPASRFLRPYMPHLRSLEPMRLRRITESMRHAAERGEVFHLWWHPHNMGIHQEENFSMLERVLEQFAILKETHGFESVSMRDVLRAASE